MSRTKIINEFVKGRRKKLKLLCQMRDLHLKAYNQYEKKKLLQKKHRAQKQIIKVSKQLKFNYYQILKDLNGGIQSYTVTVNLLKRYKNQFLKEKRKWLGYYNEQ